jgi:hypothetical protein
MIHHSQIKKANQFPMIDILNHFGYQPAKNRGSEYIYYSPFRTEKTPSFSVNVKENVSKDFGDDQYSGDAIRLYRNLTGKGFIETVSDLVNNKINIGTATNVEFVPIKTEKKAAELVLVKPEIENQNLLTYAESRGISFSVLCFVCNEVHYKQPNGKVYYSIGFKNDSGGYELRSGGNFKGCIGNKDITTYSGEKDIFIFEGFFNLLSYLELRGQDFTTYESNYIVLNSTSNVKKSFPFIKQAKGIIHLYLDNDNSGLKAELAIRAAFPDRPIISHRHEYQTDLNDFLINKI